MPMGPFCSGRPTPAHTTSFRASLRARSRDPLGAAHVPAAPAPVLARRQFICVAPHQLTPEPFSHSALAFGSTPPLLAPTPVPARATSEPTRRFHCAAFQLPLLRSAHARLRSPGLPSHPSQRALVPRFARHQCSPCARTTGPRHPSHSAPPHAPQRPAPVRRSLRLRCSSRGRRSPSRRAVAPCAPRVGPPARSGASTPARPLECAPRLGRSRVTAKGRRPSPRRPAASKGREVERG
jgi:hypothetical protein